MSRKLEGHRIAHKELDDPVLGTAKTGRISEVVVLEKQDLIIATYDDGTEAIFDRREIVDLGPKGNTNITPVLLKPRHYVALFKRPRPAFALAIAIIMTITMVLETQKNGIHYFLLLGYLVAVLIFAVIVSRVASMSRLRASGTRTLHDQ